MAKKKKQRFKLQDLRDALAQMKRLAPYVFPYKLHGLIYLLSVTIFWLGSAGRLFIVRPLMESIDSGEGEGKEASVDPIMQLVADYGSWGLGGLFLFSGVLMAIGTLGRQYKMTWLTNRATVDVQRDLAMRIMQQPMTFFNTTSKGELLSRLTNDLGGVRMTFRILYNDLVSHPIGILVLLAGAIYTSPVLSLACVVVPIVLIPVAMFAGKIKRLAKRSYEKHAELTTFFHQYFEGVRVIKAYHMEDRQEKELDRTALSFFERAVKVGKYQGVSKALVEIVMALLIGIGVVIGFELVQNDDIGGKIEIGELIQFLVFLIALYDPVRRLSNTLNQVSAAVAANERVFELMDKIPDQQDTSDAKPAPDFKEAIAFEDVTFAYIEGRPVVRNINLVAKRGTMTAFVGATGAGKSTLIDLLPRFYLPTEGRITIDGEDLAHVQQESWLKQIAVVEQETFLFNSSVRENLLVARPDATDAEIKEALEAANVYEEVLALPEGLDTELGDRGVLLSGGQRQRLAIARAFVKRAPILLLDEATSALDTETERKVQDALDRLIKGATVFAIAHRLSTIRHADQIVVIDQGEILEVGSHEELLAKRGRYALLYETQLNGAGRSSDQGGEA